MSSDQVSSIQNAPVVTSELADEAVSPPPIVEDAAIAELAGPRTPLRRHPGFDFSITGLVYCLTMILMGVAAINGQINLLFGVFGLMLGVMLVSGVICRLVLKRVRVTRQMPEQCHVGRPTTVIYEFKNQKRFWPSLSLTLLEMEGAEAFQSQPTAYMLHAAAGMTASVPVSLMPKRRGRYALGAYQLSTSFPFGFIKRALSRRQEDHVLICPAIGHVSKQLLGMCRCDQRADAPIKPRRGGQDEFYGVKEHRAGENPRWIYWRRSARTPGVLVSKEMTQVAPPRLLLLVDTYLEGPDPHGPATVERILAMAATLGTEALDQGLSVGLCAWGADEWVVVPIQQGKRQRRDLLAAMACLPTNRTTDASALLEMGATLTKQETTAVLFTQRQMTVTLADHLRGGLVVVPARAPWAGSWFSFDSSIDFTRCIPLDAEGPPKPPHTATRQPEPVAGFN